MHRSAFTDIPCPAGGVGRSQAKGAVLCIKNFADPTFWEAIGEKQPQQLSSR